MRYRVKIKAVKITSLALIAVLIAALSGCNSGGEAEVFEQSNFDLYYGAVMETENGYYYNSAEDGKPYFELHFYDKKSGKDIVLCNKPECLHDPEKNPFCAASGYGEIDHAAIYGNYFYTVRLLDEADDEKTRYTLYRSSLDGTELTEVALISVGDNNRIYMTNPDVNNMALYMDKAFIPYIIRGGSCDHAMAQVDLKTGAVKQFETLDHNKSVHGYQKLIPYDGKLYYYITEEEYRNPFSRKWRLYRYDIRSGETENIDINGDWCDYCIVDGKIVFLRFDDNVNEGRLYTLDLITREERPLTGVIRGADGESPFENITITGKVIYDGEHLITAGSLSSGGRKLVYSKEGEFLCEFEAPAYEPNKYDPTGRFNGEMHITGGKVYFVNNFEAVCCPMSDIIAGNVHWDRAYEKNNREEIYKKYWGEN